VTDLSKGPWPHRGSLGAGGRQAREPCCDAVLGHVASEREVGDGGDEPLRPGLVGATDRGVEPEQAFDFLARRDAAGQAVALEPAHVAKRDLAPGGCLGDESLKLRVHC